MCIAILKKPEGKLTRVELENCWDNNNDGAGILYIGKNNKLVRKVELKDFAKFYKMYELAEEKGKDYPMLIHFRIATSGSVIDKNAHPFIVDADMGFIHNGVISKVDYPVDKQNKKLDVSDTWVFNEMLKKLPDNWLYNETIMTLIEEYISYNKICFLTRYGDYKILNEKGGTWKEGCWFSNSSYCTFKTTATNHYPARRSNYANPWKEDEYNDEYDYYYGRNYQENLKGKKWNYDSKSWENPTNSVDLPQRKSLPESVSFKVVNDLPSDEACTNCGSHIFSEAEKANYLCEECFEQNYPQYVLHEVVY